MLHVDTSFLIRSLVGGSPEAAELRRRLASEPVHISAIAWCEFLCGPLGAAQQAAAAALFPAPEPFVEADARAAADLYNRAGRRRGSLADCMIAATALRCGAAVATCNVADFRRFVPFGLSIVHV